jgi:hypothetical protein
MSVTLSRLLTETDRGPQVIVDHIASYRDHEFMTTLAPDALVNDIQREFLGHPAIRAWAEREILGDNVTLEIGEAFAQAGNTIVRFRVEGNFDRSKLPNSLILTCYYYFTEQNGRIIQLIILHNKATAS